MKEQKQPAKTTITSKKVAKKVQFSQKKLGNRTMVPDNLIVYISQPVGGFHETSQIFTHAEIITSNDQKRDHTGWATARGKNLYRD